MAFTVEVLRGSTTYNISDGNPFRLETADLLGGASVRNIEESGPFQDGSTHLAERLDPRTLTLKINVIGASASALDGHRDTLNEIFKPVVGVPIILKITRDDGTVRQLDTRRTGPLDIPLRPENRPGNLHRAVVQLRAADPTWYDPTEVVESFVSGSADWYLANGLIGTANVHSYVENVGTAGTTTVGMEIVNNETWSVALYGPTPGTASGLELAVWLAADPANLYVGVSPLTYPLPGGVFRLNPDDTSHHYVNVFDTGTHSYFVIANSGTVRTYRDNVFIGTTSAGTQVLGTAFEWVNGPEGDGLWGTPLLLGAMYNVALDSAQRTTVHTNMVASTALAYTKGVVYSGNIDAFPVIELGGPLTNPTITNNTTGDVLNFTGGTIGSGDIWTIDLRYGRKSASNEAGDSVLQYLADDSDLTTFRIVPAPLATGGTNSVSVTAGTTDPSSFVEFTFNKRFISY